MRNKNKHLRIDLTTRSTGGLIINMINRIQKLSIKKQEDFFILIKYDVPLL